MMTDDYARIYSQGTWTAREVLDRALECARGDYQRALLHGEARLSGGDLRGEARRWGASYARSRRNVLQRVSAAGIRVSEDTGIHGRRILVLGVPR